MDCWSFAWCLHRECKVSKKCRLWNYDVCQTRWIIVKLEPEPEISLAFLYPVSSFLVWELRMCDARQVNSAFKKFLKDLKTLSFWPWHVWVENVKDASVESGTLIPQKNLPIINTRQRMSRKLDKLYEYTKCLKNLV